MRKGKMKHDCDGNPSITNYSRGCRCDLCRSIKSLYEQERRDKARKYKAENPDKEVPKQPAGKRDNPVVYADAFTRGEIMRARGMT